MALKVTRFGDRRPTMGADVPWSPEKASARVLALAGDEPSPDVLSRAFLVTDDEHPGDPEACSIQVADVGFDDLVLIPAALRAARDQVSSLSAVLASEALAEIDSLLKLTTTIPRSGVEHRDLIALDEGVVQLASVKPMSDHPGYDALLIPWNTLDDRGNFFLPGSAKKTARERKSKAPVLFEHWTNLPIGRHVAAEERDDGFYVAAHVNENVMQGAEAMSNLRFGVPLGVSVGFERLRQRPGKEGDELDRSTSPGYLQDVPIEHFMAIQEFRWWESSLVTFPALGTAKPVNVRSAQVVTTDADFLINLLASVMAGTLSEREESVVRSIVAARAVEDRTAAPKHGQDSTPETRQRNIALEFGYLALEAGFAE